MKAKIIFIFIMTVVVLVGGSFVYLKALEATKKEYLQMTGYMDNRTIVPSNHSFSSYKQSKRKVSVTTDHSITDQIAGAEVGQVGSANSNGIYDASRGGKGGMFAQRTSEKRIVSTGGNGGSVLLVSNSGSGNAGTSGGSSSGAGTYGLSSSIGGGAVTAPFTAPTSPENKPNIVLPPPQGAPVGEGWWILMLLAAGYGVIKKKKGENSTLN